MDRVIITYNRPVTLKEIEELPIGTIMLINPHDYREKVDADTWESVEFIVKD